MSLALFEIEHALSILMEERRAVAEEICPKCLGSKCTWCAFTGLKRDSEALKEIDNAIVEYVTAEVRKVDNVARYIRSHEAMADVKRREAERLRHEADRDEEDAQRVRELVLEIMRHVDKKLIEGATYKLRRQGNGGQQAVEVAQPDLVPDDFRRVTVTMPFWSWNNAMEDVQELRGSSQTMQDMIDADAKAKPEPDLSAIREALLKPEGVPGCRLKERGEHLRVS